jgi:hypothetical protein
MAGHTAHGRYARELAALAHHDAGLTPTTRSTISSPRASSPGLRVDGGQRAARALTRAAAELDPADAA